MQEHEIVLKLNQQQQELLERTVQKGIAANQADLVRLALREYAEMVASGRITKGYAGALK
ncbi:MAG: hypothetical protein JWN23_46 [Rhodocyclales bacterium]|nr:hypothetical protein [Rhodocyclales bacterium]